MANKDDRSDEEIKTRGDDLGDDARNFLYLCNFIHQGYYNIRISWGEVRDLLSFSVTKDPYEVCKELKSKNYIDTFEDEDPFMIFRRARVALSGETKRELAKGLFEIIRKVPLAYNVALISLVQRSLMMGIIGSFYDHEINFASSAEERILISAATSDDFLNDDYILEQINGCIDDESKTQHNPEKYMTEPWFNELILIIKNGYYGNGSFNYIDTLESSFRVEFTSGILEVIKNGDLLWLLLNFRVFLKDSRVDNTVKKFVRKSKKERKLDRAYAWLSIGNDFAIGFEFLIGSIEFLPGYAATLGVYLFIVGSAQLLIRPIITTSRKAHIRKLQKKKMQF